MDAQKGYVGLTGPDWYSFLAEHAHVGEVNFWQPHGGRAFRTIAPGEPFFFKLRAPYKSIGGFGFFERYEALPAWLARECFGEMNGAPDIQSMIDRITRLRGDGDRLTGNFQIGCIMMGGKSSKAKHVGREQRSGSPPSETPKAGDHPPYQSRRWVVIEVTNGPLHIAGAWFAHASIAPTTEAKALDSGFRASRGPGMTKICRSHAGADPHPALRATLSRRERKQPTSVERPVAMLVLLA